MDNVSYIFEIYKSCDPNNTDSVPASSLLNFIKPFMSDDLSELEKLQTELDPNENDPAISSSFFHRVMSDWIARVDKDNCSSNLSEMANSNLRTREEAGLSLSQSDAFVLGLSQNNASKIFSTSNVNNNTIALEEQIQKLQYELHKTSKELELVKQQLACSEEQNESLSAELSQLHKLHHREQQLNEEHTKSKQENDDIKEVASMANKKIQELTRSLLDYEKENANLQQQIGQLEDENGFLKIKIEKLEKRGMESRRLSTDLEDALDNKESEIATLMEVLDELKSKLDEKTELAEFYSNENKLSKQKLEALQNLFSDMFPDEVFNPKAQEARIDVVLYNSPKLLNQVSNPITPTIDSPLSFKRCPSSSPIKNHNNSADLFSSAGIVTALRSPHKTLKQELSEISSIKGDESEVKRLKDVLKEQEMIKNNLWEGMKHLSQDNETLREYKQGYEDLLRTVQEKEEIIERFMNVTNASQNNTYCIKDQSVSTEFWQERDEFVQSLKEQLRKQKIMYDDLVEEVENQKRARICKEDKSTETEDDIGQKLIEHLKNEMKILQENLEVEKGKVAIFQEKEMIDQCTETENVVSTWTIPVSAVPESKRTNYAKQQIKLEKLLEKQEKVEKELNAEKGQNILLSVKTQELNEEIIQIKKELEHREKVYNVLLEKMKILEIERERLQQEVSQLQSDKFSIAQDLHNSLNSLGVERSIVHGLRMEKELLVNRVRKLEIATKQECMKEISLKKQVAEIKEVYDLEIVQLKKDIHEKDNKIFKLQNQNIAIEWLLAEVNEDLSNAILNYKIANEENDASSVDLKGLEDELENSSILRELMDKLARNIKLIIQLFNNLNNKYLVIRNEEAVEKRSSNGTSNSQSICNSSGEEFVDSEVFTSIGSIKDEDSFISTNNEYLEMAPFETDSFLDNLELNDGNLRNLTRKEMEDKFTTLALVLSMDFATSSKRYLEQKERCGRSLAQLFSYISYVVALIKRRKAVDQFEIDKILESLKNISEEILKSSFRCGVLQYERRTINCWNLVTNYVATLRQESKQIIIQGSNGSPNSSKMLIPIPVQNQIQCTVKNDFVIQSRSGPWKIFKYCLVTFFLMAFILFVILVFYVDYICVRRGRQVCPLEWLLSFLVQRVHSSSGL